MRFELFYGQTFIDSESEALVVEVLDVKDGDLVDWGVLPYIWITA